MSEPPTAQIDRAAITVEPSMRTSSRTAAVVDPSEIKAAVPATKPPLKWAGGKRWQVPHLLPFWSKHTDRRLVEPFCGGLAVALSLQPEKALLNDVNQHLINFYRQLKQGMTITNPMENNESLFYQHRERFNALLGSGGGNSPEAAALFCFLNRTG